MKKFLLSVVLSGTVTAAALASGENKISYFVLSSFKADFKEATQVDWTKSADLSKATFIENKKKVEAFYDLNGTLLAVSKAIDLEELPVSAKRSFARKYDGYTVVEAIKYEGTNQDNKFERSYFLSAENDKESVIIKIANEQLSIFKKQRK